MKRKISALLPIFASARFSIEAPDDWDKMTLCKRKEYFMQHLKRNASLCHQCSGDVETDFELDYTFIDDMDCVGFNDIIFG